MAEISVDLRHKNTYVYSMETKNNVFTLDLVRFHLVQPINVIAIFAHSMKGEAKIEPKIKVEQEHKLCISVTSKDGF